MILIYQAVAICEYILFRFSNKKGVFVKGAGKKDVDKRRKNFYN